MSNTVLGIGNDIIEVERIRKAIDAHGVRFFSKLFTTREQDYCFKYKDPVPHFAGRFAAKEAIVKAFGQTIPWIEVEIINNDLGKPELTFSPSLNSRFQQPTVLISISHCVLYATAVALWVK